GEAPPRPSRRGGVLSRTRRRAPNDDGTGRVRPPGTAIHQHRVWAAGARPPHPETITLFGQSMQRSPWGMETGQPDLVIVSVRFKPEGPSDPFGPHSLTEPSSTP